MKRRDQPPGGPDPARGHKASASASPVAGWQPHMHGHGQPSVSAVCGNYNQPTPRPRPSKQTAMGAGAFAARPLPLARYTGAVGDGHCARHTHPVRMARDPDQARAAANSGRTQIKAGPRILIPERGSWRPALRNAAALAVESARGGGSPVVCRAINVRIRVTEIPRPSTHGHPVSPAAGWAAPPRPASAAKGDISSNQRRSTAAATPRPRAALPLVAISIG